MHSLRTGSTLALVMIFTIATGVVVASVAKLMIVERKMNVRASLYLEAKEAAEAVVEFGFAELSRRLRLQSAFPADNLKPGNNPLTPDITFLAHFGQVSDLPHTAQAHVLLPSAYSSSDAWGTHDTELIGGVYPDGEWMLIEEEASGNERDVLRGMNVFSRTVNIMGKATVENYEGVKITAYAIQELQVRDSPLFAHAIFYNMDMEIAPGPAMDVRGSVHVNGDAYVQSGDRLDFHKTFNATGNIYHGRHPESGQSNSNNNVRFVNGAGTLVTMKNGGSWFDSRLADWGEIASDRWDGNVQDSSHGVATLSPVAFKDYVDDNPSTSATNDALNYGYRMIEAVLPKNAANGRYSEELEKQKMAYKAGLTIEVNTSSNTYTLYSYERDSKGDIVYTGNHPKTKPLNLSVSDMIVIESFASTGSGGSEVITSGMRDARRFNKALSLVEIDIGKLREAIHDNDEDDWGGDSSQKPENWWNGVVYVKLPEQSVTPGDDGVVPSVDNWGVKLVNAKEIPNPSWARLNNIYGTAIATNNVLYVKGSFNANGDASDGSATNPDVADISEEGSASLSADAITFLSEDWDDADSNKDKLQRLASTFTEVSAAIMTGLVPSGKSGSNSYSGGVENFPRFLQTWANTSLTAQTTLRYRGSIVSLFESEIATERWNNNGNIYTAPQRDWGFHKNFGEGYYPPGTPNNRSFRRVNYRNLTEEEWHKRIEILATEMEKAST